MKVLIEDLRLRVLCILRRIMFCIWIWEGHEGCHPWFGSYFRISDARISRSMGHGTRVSVRELVLGFIDIDCP